jgi:hypothetical protein
MKKVWKKLCAVLFLTCIGAMGFYGKSGYAAEELTAKIDYDIISTTEQVETTDCQSLYSYAASVAPVSQFLDQNGNFNVVYDGEKTITLLRYDGNMQLAGTYSATKPYPLFGGAICDKNGNYYVVYGQRDEAATGDTVVLSVVKYDSTLGVLGSVNYLGSQTCPYQGLEWGTRYPFSSGNCSLALNGNTLVCSYARQMYSGHQSNHVIYVDCDTMQKVNTAPCYTSHSFDQRVIITSDGNYIFADQGDAYPRGFHINYVRSNNTNIRKNYDFTPFHFREGSNRDYGYNETYAQLGGIGEVSTGYVLAATSEKTLSLDTNPTNREYCGDSEARNLFIQIFKKDFWNYSGQDCQLLNTEVRSAQGTAPSNPLTRTFLSGTEKDYGVLWLTDYTKEYCAVNPKLIVTEDDRIILMWEKFRYATEEEEENYVATYYMVLSASGKVLQEATQMRDARLTSDEAPVYKDNRIYWVGSDGVSKNLTRYCLSVGETVPVTDMNTLTFSAIKNQNFSDGNEVTPTVMITDQGKTLIPGIDYFVEYEDNWWPGKAAAIIHGKGSYTGSKTLYFYIMPEDINDIRIKKYSAGSMLIENWSDTYYGYDGLQVVYSLNSKFTDKKAKLLQSDSGVIKGLKKNTTYYVKVRAYILLDRKRIYGRYSKVIKCKV